MVCMYWLHKFRKNWVYNAFMHYALKSLTMLRKAIKWSKALSHTGWESGSLQQLKILPADQTSRWRIFAAFTRSLVQRIFYLAPNKHCPEIYINSETYRIFPKNTRKTHWVRNKNYKINSLDCYLNKCWKKVRYRCWRSPEAPGDTGDDVEKNIQNLCNDYLKTVICMETMHISEVWFRCAADACAARNAKTKISDLAQKLLTNIYN
jgi:hypothetical protein